MKTANRKLNRLLACVLAFLLALTAVLPVFAAPVETGKQENLTITIKNNEGLPAMTGGQFTAYQIFSGTPNKESKASDDNVTKNVWDAENWNNYTLADIDWGENINGENLLQGLKATYEKKDLWPGFFDADGNNIIKQYIDKPSNLNTAADLAAFLVGKDNAFLQEFSRFIVEGNSDGEKGTGFLKKPGTDSTVTNQTAEKPEDDESSIKVSATTGTGYYLIVENGVHNVGDAVSEYILAVLGDQIINLKASVPKVDKEIVGGNNSPKGDAAGVGDYVQFKLIGTLPHNFDDFDSYKYTFHDTLSKGLTYVKEDLTHPLTVTVYPTETDMKNNENGVPVPETYGTVPTSNYNVTEAGTEQADPKCNLEVSFADLKALKDETSAAINVTEESVVVVTYYAKVNEDAVILDDGNPNTVLLEYSNDPNHDGTGKTKEKTVYVYAFGLDLTKVGSDTAHAAGLEGAGFVLKDVNDNYAIFEDQWVVNVTAADGTRTQTFYDSAAAAQDAAKDAEDAAEGTVTMTGPVRRLTGWTSENSNPTTADVAKLIADYKAKKEAFDKATNAERAENGTAYTALQAAKDKLADYLLEAGTGSNGKIPDIYGLDEGTYALEEFIVPDGYNTPEKDFDIEIDATINEVTGKLEEVVYKHGTQSVTYSESAGGDLVTRFHSGLLKDNIENQKAPFLPFTGGIGTLIFRVLGVLLIAGAVTYLVIASKKRRMAE